MSLKTAETKAVESLTLLVIDLKLQFLAAVEAWYNWAGSFDEFIKAHEL